MVRVVLWVSFVLGMASAPMAQAELLDVIEQAKRITSSEKALIQAVEAGSERVHLCKFCHGEDGNSVRPEVPNLAGQSPFYLLKQLYNFSSGHRRNNMMQDIAPSLSDDERVNVVLYFATKRVKHRQPGGGSAHGKQLYMKWCSECHGKDALGTETFPRLATQQPVYLSNTLLAVKSGHRQRPLHPKMMQAVNGLSVDEIDAVVSYLAGMKAPF